MEVSTDQTVYDIFFSPLRKSFELCESIRKCRTFEDWDYVSAGVLRALGESTTGRAFIQELWHRFDSRVGVETYFDSFRSDRRFRLLCELNERLVKDADHYFPQHDPFAKIEQLADYEIFASDGHCLAHACHDVKVGGKYRPTNHIFALNLRTRLLSYIDMCIPNAGKKKAHEITTLKHCKKELRMGYPRGCGKKIIHAYDPAVVDYRFWMELKQNGIYVVTLEKSNSRPFVEMPLGWDENDPLNEGVLADELIGSDSSGGMIRRVTYQCPETRRQYRFLTTLTTQKISPGVIALIYKNRWNIEKVFDVTKNKFHERKCWSTSLTGKKQQALAICLAHNLTVLLERYIEVKEGIIDQKSVQKRVQRKAKHLSQNPYLYPVKILTQISLQFLRWLRVALHMKKPFRNEIPIIRSLQEQYLA